MRSCDNCDCFGSSRPATAVAHEYRHFGTSGDAFPDEVSYVSSECKRPKSKTAATDALVGLWAGTNRTWLEGLALPADTWTQVVFSPSDPDAPSFGVPVCIKKGTKSASLVQNPFILDSSG